MHYKEASIIIKEQQVQITHVIWFREKEICRQCLALVQVYMPGRYHLILYLLNKHYK